MRSVLLTRKTLLISVFLLLCLNISNAQNITAVSSLEFHEEYFHLLNDTKAVVIDGRTEEMFSREHLENAINIDADSDNLYESLKQYKEYDTIVVYCTTIRRTNKIINTLKQFYSGEIICITDGLSGWKKNSLPLKSSVELSLEKIIETALENNFHLKSSAKIVDVADAAIDESKSFYFPDIDVNFQYAYLDIVPGFKREKLGNIEHTLFPFVSASQIIYNGGNMKLRTESSEIAFERKKTSYEQDILDLKFAISIIYYRMISAKNQKSIVLESLKQLDIHKKTARLMIQAGRMSELELYRISVERNALDGLLIMQDNSISSYSNELCVMMGMENFVEIVPADQLELNPFTVDRAKMFDISLLNYPMWQEFELEKLQQSLQINMRKNERLPRVSAQLWFGYEFGFESFSFSDNKRYFAGLTASVPIYDGGFINSRVKQAQIKYENIEHTQKNIQLKMLSEIENLYRKLEEMKSQVLIQEQSVELAKQGYRLALIEYNAGRRSNTDLLNIQQALIKSEFQLNEALVNYNISRLKLLYVLGLI